MKAKILGGLIAAALLAFGAGAQSLTPAAGAARRPRLSNRRLADWRVAAGLQGGC